MVRSLWFIHLKTAVYFYEIYRTQIEACDVQIEQCLSAFVDRVNVSESPLPKPKRSGKPSTNAPSFDLRTHLYRISGVDFTRINGMGVLTVQTLLSELGLDPTRFPPVKHFTSWLGLCPGSRITGGKVKSSHTRHVVNRSANALRMAAQSLSKSPTALGAFYRRTRARLGPAKATTATAHKLARIFYRLWITGGEYTDPGADYYEQNYRQRAVKNLTKKAQQLGFNLVAQTAAGGSVS